MNHRNFSERMLIVSGAILFTIGLVGAEFLPGNTQCFVWSLRAGLLLVVVGLVTAAVRSAVEPRDGDHSTFWWPVSGSDNDMRCGGHAMAGASEAYSQAPGSVRQSVGPLVNVDGSPMVSGGMVDVMGKAYGDGGSLFSSDMDAGVSITGMDSSCIGGSNW